MSAILFLFGSGWAFFLGAAMILAAVGRFGRVAGGWRASALAIMARLGLFVVLISAVPFSYWLYAVAVVLTSVWLWSERTKGQWLIDRKVALRRATAALWIGMLVLELPFHFTPRLPPLGSPPLYILADSVTAGTGSEKQTWPDLLPPSVEVHDFSRMGATAASALKDQSAELPSSGGIVLLEIGGNDLLGTTTSRQFEHDLEALLKRVAAPERTLMMFELPLPPLCNEYGRIQRQMAASYSVRLIPKHVFIRVLAASGTTLDSVHLSADGHRLMSETVWQVLQPAYEPIGQHVAGP